MSKRADWRVRRREMERTAVASSPIGPIRLTPGGGKRFARFLEGVFRVSGLYGRGLHNSGQIELAGIELACAGLPAAFDGFRILHLSDLHVGNVPGGETRLARLLAGLDCDLVAMTGDFQTYGQPDAATATQRLAPILASLRSKEGVFAVLGNHDGADLVECLEASGVRMLINEHWAITRDGAVLHLVGLDDVHRFHTPEADAVLAAHRDGFRIALVHSPEIASMAAQLGYSLYLCGHTHAGQVCLPGGRMVLSALRSHRHLARGVWQVGAMVGHTSSGAGSGLPAVRFNCPPQATLITLRRP